MILEIKEIEDPGEKSAICADITAQLPMWFGRPESNAKYLREITGRKVYAALVGGTARGLIALEYHFAETCNVWWLGVSPVMHRYGVGRALIDRAALEAQARGCRQLVVETMSPRAESHEYELTRRFYQALGFAPLMEFEPEPGDYMMWMIRRL